MKKFYILSLLLVFVSCMHIDYARRLADADSLLYVRPDSALTLLRGIPPARLGTEEERMRHALHTDRGTECDRTLAEPTAIRVGKVSLMRTLGVFDKLLESGAKKMCLLAQILDIFSDICAKSNSYETDTKLYPID